LLTTIQMAILNAVVDDYEDLERLYRSLCLEFSSENYRPDDPSAFYWREGQTGLSLAELADNIIRLVEKGYLEVRMPDVGQQLGADCSFVWKGWFGLTDSGKAYLLASSSGSAGGS